MDGPGSKPLLEAMGCRMSTLFGSGKFCGLIFPYVGTRGLTEEGVALKIYITFVVPTDFQPVGDRRDRKKNFGIRPVNEPWLAVWTRDIPTLGTRSDPDANNC